MSTATTTHQVSPHLIIISKLVVQIVIKILGSTGTLFLPIVALRLWKQTYATVLQLLRLKLPKQLDQKEGHLKLSLQLIV